MSRTTYRDQVNAVVEQVVNIRNEAEKFDNGNESAGRRARVAMMDVSNSLREIRRAMIATTDKREEAKRKQ